MDAKTLKALEEYERAGWVLVALPPDVAGLFVGRPATQQRALEFNAELQRREHRLRELEARLSC